MSVFNSFPFCLKPCGFSLRGDLTVQKTRSAGVAKGKRGKGQTDGIPNLAQIAEGCRPVCRAAKRERRLPWSRHSVNL